MSTKPSIDPTENSWWVYVVECKDATLYTGITNNVDARIKAHNEGKGAKYTRGRKPVTLRYCEPMENKSAALKRECQIKALTKSQKLALFNCAM